MDEQGFNTSDSTPREYFEYGTMGIGALGVVMHEIITRVA